MLSYFNNIFVVFAPYFNYISRHRDMLQNTHLFKLIVCKNEPCLLGLSFCSLCLIYYTSLSLSNLFSSSQVLKLYTWAAV